MERNANHSTRRSIQGLTDGYSLGSFFLHIGTLIQAAKRHAKLFEGKPDAKAERGAKFNYLLFKIAKSGISGTIEQVGSLRIYDMFEILEYLIEQQNEH